MVKNHILKFKFLKLELIDSSTGDNLDFNLNLNLNFQTEICIICFSLGKTGKTLKKPGFGNFWFLKNPDNSGPENSDPLRVQ